MNLKKLLVATAVAAAATSASASLSVRDFFADAALTVDGLGVQGAGSGTLQSTVASGSTVLKAYLYTPSIWNFSPVQPVTFEGVLLNPASGITLAPNVNPATTVMYDVTSIVKPIIDGGPGGTYNFRLQEMGDNDGSVLVVVYQNAATMGGAAIVLDGELSTTGDTTQLNFVGPYTSGDFIMSLADSFSYNGPPPTGQVTTVDVQTSSNPSSRRLTSCAGGNDDSVPPFAAVNGQLITAGGEGDSPTNPDPNCTVANQDDELYNLALGNSANASPFITAGDNFLRLLTLNPSNDDNVFGMFITSTFSIENPNPVPEPATLTLLGLGALGLAALRRRRD
ncbi:MAG TPA: PEP-CTERM sorting domain-containing protein [Burkholderiaceae bacterium]|nr:PEP-CTERM sorting domain-containing protein [Burkholderiaceae bacterium]